MKLRIFSSAACAILLSVAALAGSVLLTSADEAAAGKASKKLEGTWAVQVTIHDCQSGADLRTFPALLTFAQGGTLTETTAGFPPAARTPGHGFWRFTSGNAFAATSMAFLFGPDGTQTGMQTLTQAIEFGDDPDTFTSTASSTITDPNGNQIAATCATAVAHRVK